MSNIVAYVSYKGNNAMSLGLILVILLVIFLLGGFSGRFGGYGYGYGHSGMGIIGVILVIVVVFASIGPAFIRQPKGRALQTWLIQVNDHC